MFLLVGYVWWVMICKSIFFIEFGIKEVFFSDLSMFVSCCVEWDLVKGLDCFIKFIFFIFYDLVVKEIFKFLILVV